MTPYIKPKFKRTQYFIAKGFQLRYIGLILALMFVTAALCSYVVYYTTMVSLGEKLANVYPQGRLMNIVGSVNIRILLSMLILTPIIAFIGVFLSHKIAGPIYRIEKSLDAMAAGDLRTKVVLRKGDELVMIANAINRLQDSLKGTIATEKTALVKVISELEEVKDNCHTRPNDTSGLVASINALEKELKALVAEFEKYKLPPVV